MIPYGRQSIVQSDIDAVSAVLRSDFLTQGPRVPAFERAVAAYTGAAHGVATNSATGALHVACLALGVGQGDLVWTSPITFVASANCALYCGAEVDFVDIDPNTYNLCPDRLAEKLAAAEQAGRLPKVVIAVHLAGQSCDMERIHALGTRYGFRIVEDASHGIGGSYQGAPVGSCRFSDITVFSFHPVKIITTAEGGLALTNDPKLAAAMELFRSHGITRDPTSMQGPSHGPWYYEQLELGFNYRLTDLQAALGISQLERLDELVERRRTLVRRYEAAFDGLPLRLPQQDPATRSSWHLYVVRVPARHREIFEGLRRRGIGVNLHYIPVYLQPFYQRLGFSAGHCPEAERYYAEAISLPLYSDLVEADQERVIDAMKEVL